MSKVIGIDLGTTNSVAAVYDRDGARIITNNGQRTTPSIVAFTESGDIVIGSAGRDQQVTNPHQTIYSIKRFMGRRHGEVAMEEKIVPYSIVGAPDDYVKIKAGKRTYTPQQISGMILHEIKQIAEEDLGEPVERAVITVPAYFNDAQRQATVDAGAIAGLKVERIINEPTAAALAYGVERKGSRKIVVFDFGGGTFDLSALELGDGAFKVLAVHGNTHLGGDDFDQRIIDIVADDFRRRQCIDLRDNAMALQRLKEAAERAKNELSMRPESMIALPYVCVDNTGPKHLEYTLTRERFESVCSDLFDNLRRSCRILLAEANLQPGQIADVVMVGGSTRIPMVQKLAREVFQTDTLDKSINPDEVVALGAATLGGVLQGDLHNVHLMDVTSQALGVETADGGMKTLVPRNTHIPTSVKETFSTPRDNQTSVPVNILEGNADKAVDNRPLAMMRLTGIRRAPRGVPRIEVEFAVDADGILTVTATDAATGKAQNVTITGGCGLEDADLEQMKEATRQQAMRVEQRREQVDLRNHAEGVYQDMQRWLDHNGRMLPAKGVERIEATMAKLAKKIAKNDLSGIRSLLKKLAEVSHQYRKAS